MTTEIAANVPEHVSVALADLLLIPPLAGAELIGAPAATVTVSSIIPLDPEAPAEAGAMLVTAGAPPDELPDGCVAVVCRVAPDGDPPVPVVVLPEGAPWGAVLAGLSAALAGSPGRDEARDALRAPLVAGRGFDGLADVASRMFGAPVAILDEYLDVRGQAGMGDEEEDLLTSAVGASRGHGPASLLGPFMEQELPSLTRFLTSGPAGVTGVIVVWLAQPLSAAHEAVLAELVEACGLEHAREHVLTETEARLRGDLVEELVSGEAVSRESLVRRARHLGADLSRGAVAILGALQDPHTEGRLVSDPRLARRVMQQARATIDLHVARSLVDWRDGRLMILLPPPPGVDGREEAEEQALTLAKRLLAATAQTVPGLALTLALSRYTAEPERLGAALDEAILALSIGERLGRMGEVVTFEETGTYKLLFQIFADRPEELATFYEQTIAPLVRYDEQYQTDLVATLSTYLGNDCNLAATAGTLYTHRHTVRYRLDRIAELSGLDIGRTDDREKLSLGLKAMRLLGRRVASPEDRKRKAS